LYGLYCSQTYGGDDEAYVLVRKAISQVTDGHLFYLEDHDDHEQDWDINEELGFLLYG